MKLAAAVGAAIVLVAGARAKGPAPPPDVLVYVNNGIVSMARMSIAEDLAGTMFRKAGVRIAWTADEPRTPAGVYVCLRMEDERNRSRGPAGLAYTFPYMKGVAQVVIRYDELEALVGQENGSAARDMLSRLLAHVMVHEITHVIEGIARHSETGIMKGRLERRDLDAIGFAPLDFAPEDIRLIHTRLAQLRREPLFEQQAFIPRRR